MRIKITVHIMYYVLLDMCNYCTQFLLSVTLLHCF